MVLILLLRPKAVVEAKLHSFAINQGHHMRALTLVLLSVLALPTAAEELKLGKENFALLQEVSAENYSVEITARHKQNKKFKELVFLIGQPSEGNYYQLKLSSTKASLERFRSNEAEKSWEGRGKFLHRDSKKPDQLVRVQNSETEILEERNFLGRTGDWYRMQASAGCGRIRA